MATITRYQLDQITNALEKKLGELHDRLLDSPETQSQKTKKLIRKAGVKKAKNLGLIPNEELENRIRNILNEKIIFEVKKKRLKHREVAEIIQTHRPNITAIMNRRINNVSADLMIKLLVNLGVDMMITFK